MFQMINNVKPLTDCRYPNNWISTLVSCRSGVDNIAVMEFHRRLDLTASYWWWHDWNHVLWDRQLNFKVKTTSRRNPIDFHRKDLYLIPILSKLIYPLYIFSNTGIAWSKLSESQIQTGKSICLLSDAKKPESTYGGWRGSIYIHTW